MPRETVCRIQVLEVSPRDRSVLFDCTMFTGFRLTKRLYPGDSIKVKMIVDDRGTVTDVNDAQAVIERVK